MKQSPLHIIRSLGGAARKAGSGAFVDQGIISGLNFLTFLVLARWMPVDAFGAYVLAYSGLMFFQSFQHALVTRAHNVLGARRKGSDYQTFTQSVLALVTGGAFIVGSFLGLIAVVFWLFGLPGWAGALAGLAVASAPWLIQDAIRRLLYTSERIGAATINDAVSYILQFGAILWLYLSGAQGSVFLVLGVLGASSLVAVLAGLAQLGSALLTRPDRNSFLENTRAVWHYGKWLSSGELVGWIGQNGNTWLIGGLLGAPLVAGYRAATYVTNLFNPFDLAVSNYLPVKAARVLEEDGHSGMIRWLRRSALLLCVPYVMLATGITFFSFELLGLFYDARYTTELLALVLIISVWARFSGFLVNFFRLGLMAAERTVPVFISQIIGLIVFAVVSTALISWIGIAGAPLGKIAVQVVVGAFLARKLLHDGRAERLAPAATLNPSEA